MSGVIPSIEFNRQLVSVVRKVLRGLGYEEGRRAHGRRQTGNPTIKLAADLDSAIDDLDDATLPSALAYFLKPKTGGGWEIDTARSITLFNRAKNSSFASGLLGTWKMVLGKPCFMPYDCEGVE